MTQARSVAELFADVTGDSRTKTTFFDLSSAPWVPVDMPVDGSGHFPSEIVGEVDLHEFFVGMEVQAIDCGGYNILQTKIPPGFNVPRHRHNTDQIVFVMAGSAIQGSRELGVGEGWSTPAGNPYGIQAGDRGLTWLEVRTTPLSALTTEWVEKDPRRWVHRQV
jgi:quercetin dioxygenase-like cupin family protein